MTITAKLTAKLLCGNVRKGTTASFCYTNNLIKHLNVKNTISSLLLTHTNTHREIKALKGLYYQANTFTHPNIFQVHNFFKF